MSRPFKLTAMECDTATASQTSIPWPNPPSPMRLTRKCDRKYPFEVHGRSWKKLNGDGRGFPAVSPVAGPVWPGAVERTASVEPRVMLAPMVSMDDRPGTYPGGASRRSSPPAKTFTPPQWATLPSLNPVSHRPAQGAQSSVHQLEQEVALLRDHIWNYPAPHIGTGMSCHQCKRSHQKLIFCSSLTRMYNGKTLRMCRKKYCLRCIEKFYPNYGISLTDWKCPSCRNVCVCAACKRRDKSGKKTDDSKKRNFGTKASPGAYAVAAGAGLVPHSQTRASIAASGRANFKATPNVHYQMDSSGPVARTSLGDARRQWDARAPDPTCPRPVQSATFPIPFPQGPNATF